MNGAGFRLSLLGRFSLEHDGQSIPLRTRKIEALLAYLVLNADTHTRETLAALFWGDTPEQQARSSLRVALADLRRVLGPDALISDRAGVQFNPSAPVTVDACEFRAQATAFLKQVLADPSSFDPGLYSGDLLPHLDDDWVREERERLRQLYLDATLHLVVRLRALGRYEEAIASACRVLAVEPAEERAHQHLIWLYAITGNRPAALRQLEACRHALKEELDVEPSPETLSLIDSAYPPAGQEATAAEPTNLPTPLTNFIGREREIAGVSQMLLGSGPFPSRRRLVTLTGTGGSGKTRLAIQVARQLLPKYRHGVWWVDLARMRDPSLVPDGALRAFGLAPAPGQPTMHALLSFLRERSLLLVLDNCEHLIEACAQVTRSIIEQCTQVQVLATSREPLGVPGEQLWPISTFSVPVSTAGVEAETLLGYEAVQLFVARARTQRPEFRLGPNNATQVAKICRRLDGIPLAIELAAARTRSMEVDDILDRLQNRLLASGSSLVAPRHQTLRASLDWSYNLLSPAECLLFRRLATFVGGWTLTAAEAVCAGGLLAEEDILDLLGRLVDRSLVVAERGRFHFLETIREYALERLAEAGEAETMRARHAAFFGSYIEERYELILSREQDRAIREIDGEIDNVRAAWEWALTARQEDLIRRSNKGLVWYFEINSGFYEGEAASARALAALLDVPGADPVLLAVLRSSHGYFLGRLGKLGYARAELERACAELRQAGARSELALPLIMLGTIAWQEGDYKSARPPLEESLQITRTMDDKFSIALALFFLGLVTHSSGDDAQADEYFREALRLSRMHGQPRLISMTSVLSGPTLLALGKHTEARERLQEGLALARASRIRWLVGVAQGQLGLVLNAQGDYVGARMALLEAVALAQESGNRWDRAWGEVGLGDAELGLENPVQASTQFRLGLQLAMEADALAIALDALAGLALLRAQAGDRESALELAGHILQHSASSANARTRAVQARRMLNADSQDQPTILPGAFEKTVQRILAGSG